MRRRRRRQPRRRSAQAQPPPRAGRGGGRGRRGEGGSACPRAAPSSPTPLLSRPRQGWSTGSDPACLGPVSRGPRVALGGTAVTLWVSGAPAGSCAHPETDPHRRGQAAMRRGSHPAHNRPFSLARESVSIRPSQQRLPSPRRGARG